MKVQVRIAQVIRRTWHLIGLGVKLRAYAAVAWRGREISESVYPYNGFYKRNWTCARRLTEQRNYEKLLRQIFYESAEIYIVKYAKLVLQEKAHCFQVSVFVSSVGQQRYPCLISLCPLLNNANFIRVLRRYRTMTSYITHNAWFNSCCDHFF